MRRAPQSLLFVGIKDEVVALDDRSGTEVWRRELLGSDFVTVHWDGEALFAANKGEVFRLDPRTGDVVWHNKLSGRGRGLVTLASSRTVTGSNGIESQAEKKQEERQAAAAGAAVAAG